MKNGLRYVQVDEKVNLAYQLIGKTSELKPLLVFLHEGLGSIAQWKNFPEKLCKTLDLPGLVYERYGYGHSTALQEERKSDYLDVEGNYFLPKLIEKLRLTEQKLILVGHSDGASIALIYASLYPKNIWLVISMAAHVFNEQISVDSIKKLRLLYENNDKLKKSFEKYHFEHTDSTFYAFANTITHSSFKEWNIEHYLTNITAPIIAIQGSDDEYGTALQVESIVTKSKSKYNRNIMIPECGHSPHLEKQTFVLYQITDFYNAICNLESILSTTHE
ncbi:MAG: alpha/beta fold hydrolase [Flavobacteriales bacterium]